jgi:transglutaminase/protease-like cytokinesis protein 3
MKRYFIVLISFVIFGVRSSTGAEVGSLENRVEKFNQECLSDIDQKDSGLEKITRRLTGGNSIFAIKTCQHLALQKIKEQEYLSFAATEADQLFRDRMNALVESYPDISNFEQNNNAQLKMLTITGRDTRGNASNKPAIETVPSFISLTK